MGQLHNRRYFSPEEISSIALRIDRFAEIGRTVHLLPATEVARVEENSSRADRDDATLIEQIS